MERTVVFRLSDDIFFCIQHNVRLPLDQSIDENFPLPVPDWLNWIRHPRRWGMSGCAYGPYLPGGQAWHMTMNGLFSVLRPIRVSEPPVGSDVITDVSDALRVVDGNARRPERFVLDLAVQLLPEELSNLFDTSNMFKLYSHKITLYTVYGERWLHGKLLYKRYPWPEKPKLEIYYDDNVLTVPIPRRASLRDGGYVTNDILFWPTRRPCIAFHMTATYPHRLTLYVSSDNFITARGWEALLRYPSLAHIHSWCELQMAERPAITPESFVSFYVHKRLGDVLFLTPAEAKLLGMELEELDFDRLPGKIQLTDYETFRVLSHPEHGVLTVKPDARPFRVVYIRRGHD